jgi:wyosine [tRNA(Phe)-imidazoG37] synthetase (radical SAM superfamily)
VEARLAQSVPGDIDWLTFVGSGEPTLHSGIGGMIREVKTLTELPVAVITNGSLLCREKVRDELSAADAVLPTLDAGSPELYRRINRPHPDVPFQRHVDGLIAFRKDFAGELWVELMLLKGVNDTFEALADLARVLEAIGADKVHITLPIRPPAEPWVSPADEEGVMRARAILGEIAEITHPAEGSHKLRLQESLEVTILSIVKRHPMRREELERITGETEGDALGEVLERLKAAGKVREVVRFGVPFWTATPSRFADDL